MSTATRALVADAAAAGVARFVFASTCSNYGRMADPPVPIDETARSRLSLYAEQKVGRAASCSADRDGLDPTCLRLATVYGVAAAHALRPDRQRVHARPLGRRELEVFGEQFWRPYVHVRDAARDRPVLERRRETVAGEVFNVGHSGRELPQARPRRDHPRSRSTGGEVRYVHRDEDPRDYRVSFERSARGSASCRLARARGVQEIVTGLAEGLRGPVRESAS